jgi:SAM-dependent methyltransferase
MGIDQVASTWTRLGDEDPMWAVLTDHGRGGTWRPEEFLATGEREIAGVLARLDELGVRPGLGRALDFGCGAGRLVHGLLRAGATEVVGLDVSPPMLRTARELVPSPACRFEAVTGARLPVPDASVDLVYSCRVLQHVPPDLAAGYVAEFHRVVRPGGVVVFQVPTRPRGAAGLALRALPTAAATWLRRGMEMHGTSPSRVRSIVEAAGGEILAEDGDESAGPRWGSVRYVSRPRGT